MKTTKLFLMAFFAMMLCAGISSCGSDEPETGSSNNNNEQSKVEPSINIADGQELQFGQEKVVDNNKQSLSITFSTNMEWTLTAFSTNGGWCTPSITSGNKGTSTIAFAISANEDSEDRTSTFTVTCGTLSKNITITQKGKSTLTLSTSKFELPLEGGEIDIEVLANIDYTIEIPTEYSSWIHSTSTRAAVTTTHNYFKVDASEEYDKREAVLKVKSNLGEEEIHVYQVGGPVLVLSQNEYEIDANGGNITIVVSSNFDYKLEMPSETWIHNGSTRGITTNNMVLTIDSNPTIESRSAQVEIYDVNSSKREVVIISQFGKDNAPAGVVAVDLGLPSGTKWASMNIGATSSEDNGDYFAWGETLGYFSGKISFIEENYKWYLSTQTTDADGFDIIIKGYTKYVGHRSTYGYDGFYDDKTVLDPEDDAAHVNWGGNWRMPTRAEQEELIKNCTWSWTKMKDKNGYKVTGSNGNYIFLPAAGYRGNSDLLNASTNGYYWSSSLDSSYSDHAYYLGFGSSRVGWSYYYRYYGLSVRAVCP